MTQEVKILTAIGIITILIILGFSFFASKPVANNETQNTTVNATIDTNLLVREDSNKVASTSAKVTIVEFGDYQCPACAMADPTVTQVIRQYVRVDPLKVNVVFRNFPLPQHKNALISAEAAEAAGEQGKYWEMHSLLYEHQKAWENLNNPIEVFVGYAKDLNLNIDQFKQSVESNKYAEKINKDKQDGLKLGVNSTPTFYINGLKQTSFGFEQFKSKIEAELNK
jgi:protein-disulfide isomerase